MIERFGELATGEQVEKVTISAGGLTATILSFGATLQDLQLEGHEPPLVIGLNSLTDILAHSPYFGATVGPVANRIAGGSFEIDGKRHQLERNCLNKHTLHSGSNGIGTRNWKITETGADFVRMEILDRPQDCGFPGNTLIVCTYRLTENAALEVELTASTDQPTLCNLAHHSYFNLDGSANILDHELQILADGYLAVDEDFIPTGEIIPVADSKYDFRQMRKIEQGDIDHNYCLRDKDNGIREIARAYSPKSGISMMASTTEPGVQFYAGQHIDVPVKGLDGRIPGPNAGFCLEAQIWPDAIHHEDFPNSVLRPGEKYHQLTRFAFSRDT